MVLVLRVFVCFEFCSLVCFGLILFIGVFVCLVWILGVFGLIVFIGVFVFLVWLLGVFVCLSFHLEDKIGL